MQAKPQGHAWAKIRRAKSSQSSKFVECSLGFGEVGEFVGGSAREEEWHVGHAFGSADEEYFAATGMREVDCMSDRFHARGAVAVCGDSWNVFGDAGPKRDDSGHVGGVSRLSHTTKYHFVHDVGIQACSRKESLRGIHSKIGSRFVGQVGTAPRQPVLRAAPCDRQMRYRPAR